MLDAARLQTVLDSMAAAVTVFDAAFGVDGTVVGTISYGAAQNLATLDALADADTQADLVPTFRARSASMKAGSLYAVLAGAGVQRALDAHFGALGAGGLNQQLAAFALRVHPNLRKVGFVLDAPNVFTLAVDPLATFAVTGAGAGVFAEVQAIDDAVYAPAALQVVVTAALRAAAINATLTLRDPLGASSQQLVVIPANSIIGTAVAVPGRHRGVSAIAITGGTNGDAFKVTAPVERAVNL